VPWLREAAAVAMLGRADSLDRSRPGPWVFSTLEGRCAALAQLDGSMREAAKIGRDRSIKRAVQALQKAGLLQETDADAGAAFLRLWARPLGGEGKAGDWLSEEGSGQEGKQAYSELRLQVFKGIDMRGMSFDEAVRQLLTGGGFALPGEAQRIERVALAFSTAFFHDNAMEHLPPDPVSTARDGMPAPAPPEPPRPPVQSLGGGRVRLCSSDIAFVLSYSIIMLNTDAHNPNIPPDRKMTLKQFLRNNRGTDDDGTGRRDRSGERDPPGELLRHVYTAVTRSEIRNVEQAPSMTAAQAAGATGGGSGAVSLPSRPAPRGVQTPRMCCSIPASSRGSMAHGRRGPCQ
jgi:hypothetical protein